MTLVDEVRIPICATGSLSVPARVQSWYLVCRAADVPRGKVLSREIAGQSIVLFRARRGTINALSAHCAHMGAHLGQGAVVGDCLRCPLHHWRYDGEGRCRQSPGQTEASDDVRQLAYPVAERYGCVFVFSGPTPLFPLPSFSLEPETDLSTGAGRSVLLRCPWFAVAANAFDQQHLETVHRRALRASPVVEALDRYRMRLRYVSRVLGRSAADRTMRWLSHDRIAVTITCWGGSVITVETDVGRARSMLLLGLRPVEGGTEVTPVVAVRRTGAGPADRLRVALSQWLFGAFLARDTGVLEGMRFRPRLPLPPDEPLGRFLEFLHGLPPAPVA